MSFHEPIERSKLNQAMYKKLKKFIMCKRKRQVEKKEHDDQYKRSILEKAKRKRQAQIDHDNMEGLQKELAEAIKRRDELLDKKNSLFARFKQLANDESALKDKQKSEVQQLAANAGLTRPQYHLQQGLQEKMSTSISSNSAIPTSMLSYTQSKMDQPGNDNNNIAVANNQSQMAMSVNDLAAAIRYSGVSPALIEALYKNNNTQRLLNQAVVSSLLSSQQGSSASGSLQDSALAALFGNLSGGSSGVSSLLNPALLQQQQQQQVDLTHGDGGKHASMNPLMAQLQQMDKFDGGLNAATLNALSQQLDSIRQAPNNSQRLLESLKQNCYDTYGGGSAAAAAFNSLVNGGVLGGPSSSMLPPAPTSYRGSITTGQSAQNIQLQQVYQQQQQQQHMLMAAAAAKAGQQQHHGLGMPPISTNVLVGAPQTVPNFYRGAAGVQGQSAALAAGYSSQAQLVHQLNALAASPQHYRQQQPPHSVHNSYY